MSYRVFDGYMSPRASDGYVHVNDGYASIYLFDGYNLGIFDTVGGSVTFDSGLGIIHILNRTAAPTTNTSQGVYLYAEGGDGYMRNTQGWVQSVTGTRIVRQLTTDANYNAVQADYQARIMEVTSSLSLTATRNFVLPLVSGYEWIVFNNTTGAQSIQFIGSSGAGVTVTNGKRAIIYCDGTNIQRVTTDT